MLVGLAWACVFKLLLLAVEFGTGWLAHCFRYSDNLHRKAGYAWLSKNPLWHWYMRRDFEIDILVSFARAVLDRDGITLPRLGAFRFRPRIENETFLATTLGTPQHFPYVVILTHRAASYETAYKGLILYHELGHILIRAQECQGHFLHPLLTRYNTEERAELFGWYLLHRVHHALIQTPFSLGVFVASMDQLLAFSRKNGAKLDDSDDT